MLALLAIKPIQAQNALRPNLARPLQSAQELLKAGNPQDAVSVARSALLVADLTANERVMIEKIIATSAIQAKDFKSAIASLNFLIDAVGVPEKERQAYQLTLIGVLRSAGDLEALAKVAKAYLDQGGVRQDVRALYLQVLSIQKRHQEVVDYLTSKIQSDNAERLTEDDLKILAIAKSQLNDGAGYYEALKQLVGVAPKQLDYWRELISQLQKRPFFSVRYELDVARLMAAKNLFQTAEEYLEYAELAMKFGFPTEAKLSLDAGVNSNLFDTAGRKAALQKTMDIADRKIREDEAQIKQLQKSTGTKESAELGEILLSMSNHAAAIGAYRLALEGGVHRREMELRLHFLIALSRAGSEEDARKELEKIKSDATAYELGQLWLIKG